MALAFRQHINDSPVTRCFKLLGSQDRKKLSLVILFQICLGFVDLVGVAVVGVLGALAVTGVQSQQPGTRISIILDFLQISNLGLQKQVAILGITSALIFVFRTITSMILTRRILHFLSNRGAAITSSLISKLLSQSLLQIQVRSTQETVYALTVGVSSLTLGVIASAALIVSDFSLFLILIIGLCIVDLSIALITIVFFGILALVLYQLLNVRAHNLGDKNSKLTVQSNEKIVEAVESFRESVVRNRRSYYVKKIGETRYEIANVLADIQYLPNISKYVIEAGLVIGAVFVAGIQFGLQDARHAVATLSVFLAAGSRIAPALMRIQVSLITLKNSLGGAFPTLKMIDSLENIEPLTENLVNFETEHIGFEAKVSIKGVSLRYPNSNVDALHDIYLEIPSGETLAIVGSSGAGKTSLVDAILGVVPISSGQIEISSEPPSVAVCKWPGAIAYVPQDIYILDGSIRDNVSLGYPVNPNNDSLVWAALETAQMANFVRELPQGLDTHVGERGALISGGQRQRLGIARAMFTKPKLLVLDEATSSLDGQTEADLSEALRNLQGSVTVVLIAHRLSTLRKSLHVVYMERGSIVASGTFDSVRQTVPDFEKQAQLMGL